MPNQDMGNDLTSGHRRITDNSRLDQRENYKKKLVIHGPEVIMETTKRFSDRVDNYVKFRPSYPQDMVDYLFSKSVNNKSIVCDIGSGTGILSSLLVKNVDKLIAIEPNTEMREYAEKNLNNYSNFKSIDATAEETPLEDNSVDVICAAQAFHWFDKENCKKEFKRILKPKGIVFLIWNNRINDTIFLEEYDKLLYKYGTDYSVVNHQNLTDDDLKNFFNGKFRKQVFPNHQDFDLEGFLGRVFSSSYTPQKDHPNYNVFLKRLTGIYDKYNDNGIVKFNYQTEVYSGQLD